MKKTFVYLACLFVLASCEETIPLDLEQTPPLLVIEGLVTNNPDFNYVQLSESSQFYDKGQTPRVSGAEVFVTDGQGRQYAFSETDPGLYKPVEPLIGVVGQTYELTVTTEGKTYRGSETMLPVQPIDSLTHAKVTDVGTDNEDAGRFYELYMYMREPQDQENYYLFKFYRNQEVLDFDGLDIYAFDDEALAGTINGIATPEYYALGDLAKVELFSITRRAFRYYTDLSNTLNNDGGLFSGIPANAISNLEGGAIGYFQVSNIDVEERIIE